MNIRQSYNIIKNNKHMSIVQDAQQNTHYKLFCDKIPFKIITK